MNKLLWFLSAMTLASVFVQADIPCTDAERAASRAASDLVEVFKGKVTGGEVYYEISFPATYEETAFSYAVLTIGEVRDPEVIVSLATTEKDGRYHVFIDTLERWKSMFTVSASYGRGCIGMGKTIQQ